MGQIQIPEIIESYERRKCKNAANNADATTIKILNEGILLALHGGEKERRPMESAGTT